MSALIRESPNWGLEMLADQLQESEAMSRDPLEPVDRSGGFRLGDALVPVESVVLRELSDELQKKATPSTPSSIPFSRLPPPTPSSSSCRRVGLQTMADDLQKEAILADEIFANPSKYCDALVPVVSLSCPHHYDRDFSRPTWGAVTEGLHLEAVRRLPVDEMPELVECLIFAGHCVGLLDPVSNIIFNALNLLSQRRHGSYLRPAPTDFIPRLPSDPRHKSAWRTSSDTSYKGLLVFMRTYFRYLTEEQAMRYIHFSRGDLVIAIRIAELELSAAVKFQHQDDKIMGCHPDLFFQRAQLALKVAAVTADLPMPKDIVLLCQPRLQVSTDMKAMLATLDEERCLSVDDINRMLKVLQVSFRERVSTAMSHSHSHACLTDLRPSLVIHRRLKSCLGNVSICNPCHKILQIDNASECQYVKYLKMGLLDTIHSFYIQAVTKLTRTALQRLLPSILAAGHCHGPMDPISNIIINSIWYEVVGPSLQSALIGEPDILSIASIHCLEVSSVDGLVTLVRCATGFSEHKAIEYLCTTRCDLSRMIKFAMSDAHLAEKFATTFSESSIAAQHPLQLSFMNILSDPPLMDILTSLLPAKELDDSIITQLHEAIKHFSSEASMMCATNHVEEFPELAATKNLLEQKQKFIREEIEELLHEYTCQHPEEPLYKLDLICGVEQRRDCLYSNCYHVNFLATVCNGSSPSPRMLFFAQIWGSRFRSKQSSDRTGFPSLGFPVSHSEEISFCSPLPYYDSGNAYLGRCSMCEPVMSKIVHPPSGVHIEPMYTEPGIATYAMDFVSHASMGYM